MTRTRIALTLTTVSLAGLLGLTACGAGPSTPAAAAADVSDEATVLAQVGFETGLEDDTTPSTAASADAKRHGPGQGTGRRFLRKNTLHGEVTVQTKSGVRTVVVQRGTVTAVSADGVTVKSTDGFAQTWSFGDRLKVRQDRKPAETSAIKAGAQVGVAGLKDGDTATARLIAVK
ncbi:hypothetical protein EV385_0880 [Krasilnikovia cinnamomea]|uniref:DUF5666 domain-containing protein n=1 Tax=Krasilnikovia cinnamomea TaxID=349313 RepID=A0A4Q7ZFN2_9ACTN|nr:hypothetical protein [Krasilnikovia cinnamomea]RZU49144.1 hypothetical protein EV385_0880 [Krasilnikovia cinnamomea]